MPRISDPTDFHHSAKPTIVVQDLVKSFSLKHNRSFKESFVAMFSKAERSTSFRAVDGVSFEVGEGEALAVLGRNGSGKSTTLKLISGVQQPDEGWVRTRGRVGGLLEVGAGFHPDLTGKDNIYLNAAILGMSKEETEARYEEIVDFAGFNRDFLDTEVKRYSSGMKSRLGFAVAVHTEVDVLLVDEVLSVGDAAFRAKCNDKILEMREHQKTLFVVSHNLGTVKRLCQRGLVLKEGKVVFDGPIEEAVEWVRPPATTSKPKGSPKTPQPVVNLTEFTVAPEFQFIFRRKRAGLGQPIGDPQRVDANGGGLVQHFESGIAMRSSALEITQYLKSGPFLATYLDLGGPEGKWGFLVGRPEGADQKGRPVKLRCQYGVASHDMSVEDGAVTFREAPLFGGDDVQSRKS